MDEHDDAPCTAEGLYEVGIAKHFMFLLLKSMDNLYNPQNLRNLAVQNVKHVGL